jgi:hypothetical protein
MILRVVLISTFVLAEAATAYAATARATIWPAPRKLRRNEVESVA